MSQASILRNNIALSMAFAEPSEVAAGYQPCVQETAPAGRSTASKPEDGIVAEVLEDCWMTFGYNSQRNQMPR